MGHEIELSIPAFPPVRRYPQTISLSGINVVLGLNGSGKTKLLKTIEDQAKQKQIPVLHIQGYRFDRAPYATAVSSSLIDAHRGRIIEAMEQEYLNSEPTGQKIDKAFRLLSARDYVAQETYRSAVVRWYEGERQASEEPPKPVYEISQLLSSITRLLPHIEFVQNDGYIQARYKKQGNYHIHEVSDGEREIICNFVNIWVGIPKRGLLLVDEPELHLHSSLACQFWKLVEEKFTDTTFLYTTHYIGFSLRSCVNNLFHIGNNGQLVKLPKIDLLSRQERADFLGAIPGILRSSKLLFCEGTQQGDQEDSIGSSMDFEFYSWLLRDENITIQSMGTSSAVIETVKSAEVIHQLSKDVAVAGVVDRDDYPEERIRSHESVVEVLSYHEVESYLCNPEVLLEIAKFKAIKIDRNEILEILINYAKEQVELVASRRFTNRKQRPDQQFRTMEEEKQRLMDAISRKDPELILRYFHGKELANKIASSVGCKNSTELFSIATSIVKPENIEALRSLRIRLLTRLDKQ